MGERGRQLVTPQYDFSKYLASLENLFRRVIAQKQPHRSPELVMA
jgi:hypothetical protein